jgi:threonylcarbamoyladenosine tRNA methylthiotransferase MtaB
MRRTSERFSIFTTGCKANQWDSHVIAERLKSAGLSQGTLENSDIIVVNACSLTARAEADARRFIAKARRRNGGARIALVGCHAQAYQERDFGADLVLGQEEKFDPEQYLADHGCFVVKKRSFSIEALPADWVRRDRTRCFFKIQDGCNKFCTYCVVPYARGAIRSRPASDIAAFMEVLAKRGTKEVVLTGIDLAAYSDPGSGRGLTELLQLLETLDTPFRIRLSSIDPEYIDERFVEVLAASRKIAKSIHIPVQSGSNAILEAMGRRYRRDLVTEVVDRLLARVEGIGIGMDIMAGFPGEDGGRFEETFEFIEGLDIYYLHVFPFSEREGTRACAFPGKVADDIKRQRVKRLKILDARKRAAFSRRFIGRILQVIPEGRVYKDGFMKGFSDNYLPVYLPYEKSLENNLVEVTIEGMQGPRLIGGH